MSRAAPTDPRHQVFVVGMNGSGTTMLADSLGRHPLLWMFPFESQVIPHFLQGAGSFGTLEDAGNRRRLADAIGSTKPFWHAAGKRPLVVPDQAMVQARTVADMFDAIFRHLAAQAGKPGWVEKSPVNTSHIGMLAMAFPQARFVQIIRDGRDAAQSFHRRWGYHPGHTVWRWKQMIRHARAAGAELGAGRYAEVRYEALTEQPALELKRICAFLQIDFSDDMLVSSMRHMDRAEGQGEAGRIVSNAGKWQDYFTAAQARALECIAGRQLGELGYAVGVAGDADLSPLRRRLLRSRDAVFRSAAFLRAYGWQGLPMFLRVARTSLQMRGSRRF